MLQVSNEGLQALAAHCATVSVDLMAKKPVPSVGLPTQATSAAVVAGSAAVGCAVTVLAGRAHTRGVKAATAGAGFAVNESAAARDLAALLSSNEVA